MHYIKFNTLGLNYSYHSYIHLSNNSLAFQKLAGYVMHMYNMPPTLHHAYIYPIQ